MGLGVEEIKNILSINNEFTNALGTCHWNNNQQWEDYDESLYVHLIKNVKLVDDSIEINVGYTFRNVRPYKTIEEHEKFLKEQNQVVNTVKVSLKDATVYDFIDHIEIEWNKDEYLTDDEGEYEPTYVGTETLVYSIWKRFNF